MPTRQTGRTACRAEGIAIRAAWLTGRHLAASLGAECGVCFPSFEDGTLGITAGVSRAAGGLGSYSKSARKRGHRFTFLRALSREPKNQCDLSRRSRRRRRKHGSWQAACRRRSAVARRAMADTVICRKKQKSRASRLAKPDARHHGVRQDDPAHKPASSVDAVRVPHGVRRRRTREQQERSR